MSRKIDDIRTVIDNESTAVGVQLNTLWDEVRTELLVAGVLMGGLSLGTVALIVIFSANILRRIRLIVTMLKDIAEGGRPDRALA